MINLLNDFMSASLPLQLLMILWGGCVVAFYTSLVVLFSNVFYGTIKKVI